ncbi:hypothetical protein G7046_g4613 [Stylonectria norvegica]|nr:hypothetical protein G7046_g4613 [Stylonectria norvegica]
MPKSLWIVVAAIRPEIGSQPPLARDRACLVLSFAVASVLTKAHRRAHLLLCSLENDRDGFVSLSRRATPQPHFPDVPRYHSEAADRRHGSAFRIPDYPTQFYVIWHAEPGVADPGSLAFGGQAQGCMPKEFAGNFAERRAVIRECCANLAPQL